VHTCGALSESHVPAQAEPFAAMVSTAVLLDWNEIGVTMICLLLFCGVPMNDWMAPTSMETALVGERMMLAGTGNSAGVLLLLPQPASAAIKRTLLMMAIEKKTDLPIHPPHPKLVHGASTHCGGKFPV
jgi:hypothetical protein